MLRNTLRRMTALTLILICGSFLTLATGCEKPLGDADVKVQERAAYPRYF